VVDIFFVLDCLYIICVLIIQALSIHLTSFRGQYCGLIKLIRNIIIFQMYSGKPQMVPKTKVLTQSSKIVWIMAVIETNYFATRGSNVNWSVNFILLAIDSLSSVCRMFAALWLSFVTAIIFGIIAARKPLASKIIIPVRDILQSVSILGFFPAAFSRFLSHCLKKVQ
jgi:ABC-type nitrate/sulfonate/bicarbonate transport system permease component